MIFKLRINKDVYVMLMDVKMPAITSNKGQHEKGL